MRVTILCLAHYFFYLFDRLWNIRQIFIALPGDDQVVLNSNTTKIKKILNLLFHQKFRNCGVLKCRFQQSRNKIDSRLESDYHSWHQIPSNAQIPDAGTVDTFHTFGVSPTSWVSSPRKCPSPCGKKRAKTLFSIIASTLPFTRPISLRPSSTI